MKPYKILKKKVHGYIPIVDLDELKSPEYSTESELEPVALCCSQEYAELIAKLFNRILER